MSSEMRSSHIIICQNIEERSALLIEGLKPNRCVLFQPEEINFKIEISKAVIAEAYIAEEEVKYLIISARSFTVEAQNALLKILEEPPRNIEIIIVTESKSVLLPTVRSRLQVIMEHHATVHNTVEIDLLKFSLGELFRFVKAHERLAKDEAKGLIEAIYYRATAIDGLSLNEKQIERFDRSYRLIHANARPQPVLTSLLMTFLKPKNAR